MNPTFCDFCSSPMPLWRFRCASCVTTQVGINLDTGERNKLETLSEGDWLACDSCKGLIEEQRWVDLARRASKEHLVRGIVASVAECYQLQQAFVEYKLDEPPARIGETVQ